MGKKRERGCFPLSRHFFIFTAFGFVSAQAGNIVLKFVEAIGKLLKMVSLNKK